MEKRNARLSLRKKEDWLGGAFFNTRLEGDGLTLGDARLSRGFYVTRVIDGGENGHPWRRVTLEATVPDDALISVCALVTDYVPQEPQTASLSALRELFGAPVSYMQDFYVNRSGRYLCLLLEFMAATEPPVLQAINIHYDGDHMTEYLPEIYDGDFTYRFLSVFDSFYLDMERAIEELPARFDFERADGELLEYLASWTGTDVRGLAPEELRERVRSAVEDFEDMYTPAGIKRTVRRLTGRTPILIEHGDVDPNRPECREPELYRRLYGSNPFRFFVLLPEDAFRSREERELFLLRMRDYTPANLRLELVLLRSCTQLGTHTYLGINSYIGSYVPVKLDGSTTIQYDSMIGGEKIEGF